MIRRNFLILIAGIGLAITAPALASSTDIIPGFDEALKTGAR